MRRSFEKKKSLFYFKKRCRYVSGEYFLCFEILTHRRHSQYDTRDDKSQNPRRTVLTDKITTRLLRTNRKEIKSRTREITGLRRKPGREEENRSYTKNDETYGSEHTYKYGRRGPVLAVTKTMAG